MKLLYRRSNLKPLPKPLKKCCGRKTYFIWHNDVHYCHTCLIRELYKHKRSVEKRKSTEIEKETLNIIMRSLNEL